jgi:putative transcriptional regulator
MASKKSKNEAKSDAFEAIHSAASSLHSVGAIEERTMNKFDVACLVKTPKNSAIDVKRIRETMNVSQAIFANYLNTSVSTIQRWESRESIPRGPAAKLLEIVERHGGGILT